MKLTRVALLAPLVVGVTAARRRGQAVADRPPVLPWFVGGFLTAVTVRSTGVLPVAVLDAAAVVESLLLMAAMIGLGAGVRIGVLRSLAWQPLVLGAAAWILVAGVALCGVTFT